MSDESELTARIRILEDQNKRESVYAACSQFDFHNAAAKNAFVADMLKEVVLTESGQAVIGGRPVNEAVSRHLGADSHFYLKQKGSSALTGSYQSSGGRIPSLDDIKLGMSAETEKLVLDRLKFLNSQTPTPWLRGLR